MNPKIKTALFISIIFFLGGFYAVLRNEFHNKNDKDLPRLIETTRIYLDCNDIEHLHEIESKLSAAFGNFPKDVDLCLTLMSTYVTLGEYEKAVQAGEIGIKHNPNAFQITGTLARAYVLSGNDERAYGLYQSLQFSRTMGRKAWREYIKVGRRLWQKSISAGDRAMEKNDLDRAFNYYTRASMIAWNLRNVAEGLASARLHFSLADIYRRKNDTRHAIQAYRSGLRFDPWRADMQLACANLEEQSGMPYAALLHYRASLRIDPKQNEATDILEEIKSLENTAKLPDDLAPQEIPAKILIIPVGDVDVAILKEASNIASDILKCRFEFLERQEFPRLTRLFFVQKYDADRLYDIFRLRFLEKIDRPGIIGAVAVCNKDLGLLGFGAYVYSWTSKEFAIASTLRLDDAFYAQPHNRDVFLKRVAVQLIMCSARVCGLDMCENVPCALAYPGNIEQIALKEPTLCPRCAAIFQILAEQYGVSLDFQVINISAQLDDDPSNKELAAELERLEQTRQKQYDAMINRLNSLLEYFPDDIAILLQIGAKYYDSGRFEQSKQIYGKALELNPANFDAKYGLDAATDALKQSGNQEPKQP